MASTPPTPLPTKMKACLATGFGEIDENIHLSVDAPVPTLSDNDTDSMIVKVLCCALAPGDVRVLSGKTSFVQTPACGFPYVPGSDTAGIVVAVAPNSETKFHVGDYVVSRFELPGPVGGLAQYRKVKTALSEKFDPQLVTPEKACGLTASALSAKRMVHEFVHEGDRVLVIGGSGGVGTSVLQYAKLQKPSFLAAVSTQSELCTQLGADRVIDYRTTNWWEVPEFQQDKFDVVLDMVNGDNWTMGGRSGKAVKKKRNGGVYVLLPIGVQTEVVVQSRWDMVKMTWEIVFGLMMFPRLHPKLPKFAFSNSLDTVHDGDYRELLEDVVEGRLKPILDPASPLEFTLEGVRRAFAIQKSLHAHGKVVVKIAEA